MKILITSALPYANGIIHLGHLKSTFLPSDIYARFCRLFGYDVLYVSATDEHGTPIMINAEKEGKTPEEYAKFFHEKDKEIFNKLGISFDIFHRTSSKENEEFTLFFYNKLKENGFIYEKEIEQFYCEHCERFLPDRYVKGKCPYCGAEDQYGDACEKCGKALSFVLEPKCAICKNTPIKKKSKHLFFKLSAFSDDLEEYIKNNSEFKEDVKKFVEQWLKQGLQDWDISRDMKWGFKIPDSDLVFYVWFDAPIGYISSAKAAKENWKEYWDSKVVHFIGKDIIYHHYLFWPAMLKGVNYKLPDAIPARGFLNLEGKKFSKSRGWYISAEEFLRNFPADYLRYYLTSISPYSLNDSNFTWKEFQEKINNELIANIGNFIYRTLKLIEKLNEGKIPERIDDPLLLEISKAKKRIKSKIDHYEMKEALDIILETTSLFNKYLSDKEPWKTKDLGVLYVCSRWLSALSILLEPYIPFSAKELQNLLNIKPSWELLDKELLFPGKEIKSKILFKKIDDKKIEEMYSLLKKK